MLDQKKENRKDTFDSKDEIRLTRQERDEYTNNLGRVKQGKRKTDYDSKI